MVRTHNSQSQGHALELTPSASRANLLPQTLPQLPRPVLPHSAPSSTLAPPNPAAINMLAADSSPGSQASPSTGGIPPSPSLRDNSLASLVEAAEAKSAPAPEARPRGVPQDIYSDPINLRELFTPSREAQGRATHQLRRCLDVLSLLDAQQLVSYFHVHLNPFIILFDRRLHTLEHLRATSGVLFTAILAVSAKFFARHLYPSLLSHANQLVTRGMSGGHSHIGLVQALCLLVYWKVRSGEHVALILH